MTDRPSIFSNIFLTLGSGGEEGDLIFSINGSPHNVPTLLDLEYSLRILSCRNQYTGFNNRAEIHGSFNNMDRLYVWSHQFLLEMSLNNVLK